MPNDYADIPASAAPNGEIPNPVRPVVEHTGWALPYRGFQAHGVDPNSSRPESVPSDLFDQGTVQVDEQAEPTRAETPVPVRIVESGSRENKEFLTAQEVAFSSPSMIAGRSEQRTKLMVKNVGTVSVYIGNDNRVNTYNGYPLAANESVTLDGWGAVWAVSSDGTNQPVAILSEYVVSR